ncbi:hypothetical protein CYMTET_28267 [Cymbomonas tetramitiformis]|uniref:Importin N-terminal domain-containing protein n=1 Tax=Cymbomonas tetramitiformis TaxID=36881 RepID=A0AAE0FN72_9CHLO|nr:hypothetical protein CYMTET_28267 [Cymbomonas tetramitiformis]|eukprot:gene18239-21735_t
MDVQTLVTVLSAVLSPNEVERKAAEEHLKKAQDAPGHLVMLMQAVVAPQLDPSIRQAAAIHFKQLLSKRWKPSESQLKEGIQEFSPEDKQVVRDNVLEAIIQAPPKIRSQLGECLKSVVENDYPHAWPGLLPLICQNLQMQDLPRLYGALYALRMLSNKYEFKDEDERVHIQEVVNTTFPTLLQIFQQLAQHNSAQVELAELMKLICKTFWSSTFLDIPQHLLDAQVFMAWMSVFDQLLAKPVPAEGAPTDPDELKSWPWWKLKKWTLHVINRMFSRFGDSKQLKDEVKEFSKQFRNTCSTKFLGSYLQLLDGLRHGAYLPDRVVNLALQYVMTGVTKPATYKMMKPQLNIILFEIAFPLLCFNENDHMLWVEDPHEYVRKGYDVIEDMYSPRTAAMHLIIELVNCRSKDCLQPFIAFLVDIFTKYSQAAPEARPYNIK